jgi:hypothetical protein
MYYEPHIIYPAPDPGAKRKFILGKLVFSDLVSNNTFKSYAEITANTSINLNLVLYFRLRHAIMTFLGTILRRKSDGTCVSLSSFFRIKYSPSRKIRLFLDNFARKNTPVQLRTTKTFLRLTELNNTNFQIRLSSMLAIWNTNCLTNKFREFCFKFFNNQLSINTRLSHFVQGQTRTTSQWHCSATGGDVFASILRLSGRYDYSCLDFKTLFSSARNRS